MRAIVALVSASMLLWVEAGGTQHITPQKTYSLTVSVHKDVPKLTDKQVKEVLNGASQLLASNQCHVTFKLKGTVKTFASPETPSVVRTAEQRDAVHRIKANVKVVKEIRFCRPELGHLFNGCAFPPSKGSKSIILTHVRAGTVPLRSILWAHEFGHRTGLQHRAESDALMTVCPNLFGDATDVNKEECKCFLLGPGGCTKPVGWPVCSDRHRVRSDPSSYQ